MLSAVVIWKVSPSENFSLGLFIWTCYLYHRPKHFAPLKGTAFILKYLLLPISP